jgi:hypothetical protein
MTIAVKKMAPQSGAKSREETRSSNPAADRCDRSTKG